MTPVQVSRHPQLCQSYKEVCSGYHWFHWKFWTFLHLNAKNLDEKNNNTKLIVKNYFVICTLLIALHSHLSVLFHMLSNLYLCHQQLVRESIKFAGWSLLVNSNWAIEIAKFWCCTQKWCQFKYLFWFLIDAASFLSKKL